jgi:protein-disulfide isomerase
MINKRKPIMRSSFRLLLALLLATLTVPAICPAEVQHTTKNEITLKTTPLDIAISRDGQWVYMLLKGGTLQVYTYDGKLKGAVDVGDTYDHIEAGPIEDEIYLLGTHNKTVRIIELLPEQKIDISGSPYKGAADAHVVIVEFSDFQCPYCAQLAQTLDKLLLVYPGQLKIVYKCFPLHNHPFAWKAAAAAMAAHHKGQFWKFHDRLYENYNHLDDRILMDIRKEFGLDTPEFDTLMKSPEVRSQVAMDRNEGQRLGVRNTPTVFINGKHLKDKSLEGFRAAIDKELKSQGK